MKPLSRSSTASRIACAGPPGPDGAALSAAVKLSVIGCKCMAPLRPRRVLHEQSSQDLHMDDPAPCGDQGSAPSAAIRLAGGRVAVAGPREGMGGVGELPEQARHDEGDLLADVDRVVADALQGARHE